MSGAVTQRRASHGVGVLTRLALRRDRWLLTGWIGGITAMAAMSVSATRTLLEQDDSMVQMAQTLNSTPALVAMYGPLETDGTLAEISLFKLHLMAALLFAGVMAFVMVRHTRDDEAGGQFELMAGTQVSRRGALTAALLVAVAASELLTLLVGLSLMGSGLDAANSWAVAAGWGAMGIFGAGLGAVLAQVASSGRQARIGASLVLGASYFWRAQADLLADDVRERMLAFSPLGWLQLFSPFAQRNVFWLVLPVAFGAVLMGLSYVLMHRREYDTGLLAQRASRAGRPVRGLGHLVRRLNRKPLISWGLIFASVGGLIGGIALQVENMMQTAEMEQILAQLGEGSSTVELFVTSEFGFFTILAVVVGILALLRLRQEETSGRAEGLLALPITRDSWVRSWLAIIVVSVAVVYLLAVASMALALMGQELPQEQVNRIVAFTLGQLAAIFVLVAVAFALWAWVPQRLTFAWAILAVSVVLAQFGELINVPDALQKLSPWYYAPALPWQDGDTRNVLVLAAVAVALFGLGLWGARRRDLTI